MSTHQSIDNSSISAKNETYSYKSPSESPFRNDFTSSKFGLPVQQGEERIIVSQHDGPFDKQTTVVLGKPEQGIEDAYTTGYFSNDLSIFWNQIESSRGALFSSSSLSNVFSAKEKENEGNKEPLKAIMQGHFRALVLQFPQGEGIKVGKEDGSEDWLDIVATLKSIIWRNYCLKFMDSGSKKGGLSKGENRILQRVKQYASLVERDEKLMEGSYLKN
ncbi:hypothetical protein K1719_026624 [Acacia pycnantha]|nr:hypothetical protein K1719_026624 [Acacia pycnantha]